MADPSENPLSFAFWANRSTGPGSYEALQARRKIAETLLGKRSPFPKTFGEGLTYAGERIADVMMERDLDRREAALGEQRKETDRRLYPETPEPAAEATPPAPRQEVIPATTTPPTSSLPTARPPVEPPPDRATEEWPISPQPSAAQVPFGPRDAIAHRITRNMFGAEPILEGQEPMLAGKTLTYRPPRGLNRPPSFNEASAAAGAPGPTQPAITPPPATGVPLPPPRPVYNRNRQIAQMQADPSLENRILTIMKGEVGDDPQAQKLIAETIMNRDAARAPEEGLRRITEEYTGRGSTGYYPRSTFGRGQGSRDILNEVLRGSDLGGQVLGFSPTGNASGGVAARGIASGRYNNAGRFGPETFVTQERPYQLERLAGTRLSNGFGLLPGASSAQLTGATDAADAIDAAIRASQPNTEGGGGEPTAGTDDEASIPPTAQMTAGDLPPNVQMAQVGTSASPPTPQIPAAPHPLSPAIPAKPVTMPDRPALPSTEFPPHPIALPVSRTERELQRARDLTGDPTQKQMYQTRIDELARARTEADKRAIEQYKAEVAVKTKARELLDAEAAKANTPEARRALQQAVEKDQREAHLREQFGPYVEPKEIFNDIRKSHDNLKDLPSAMSALREAKTLVNDPRMIVGGGASTKVNVRKFLSGWLGAEPSDGVTLAERLQGTLKPVISAARPEIAGTQQQSIPELRALLNAVGADMNLERNTIIGLLNSLERRAMPAAVEHNDRTLRYVGPQEVEGNRNTLRQMQPYFLRMNEIVPDVAVTRFKQDIERRGRDKAIETIDQEFKTPGLGLKLLQSGR